MAQISQSRNSAKKGQTTLLDLVISLSVFMAIIAILYSAWFVKIDNSSQDLKEFRASIAAQKAMNALVESPGFPTNWAAQNLSPNSDSLKGIGIAESKGAIDERKLIVLQYYYNSTQSYNNSRLKMGIAPFNADIRISYLNSTNISIMGSAPAASDTILASLQKSAVYKNQTVLVRVRLWEQS